MPKAARRLGNFIPFANSGGKIDIADTREKRKKGTGRRTIANQATLRDMEGAAVIQTANTFNIPCLIFKFVSDTCLLSTQDRIVKQIKELRDSFCLLFIDFVLLKRAEKTFPQWLSFAHHDFTHPLKTTVISIATKN